MEKSGKKNKGKKKETIRQPSEEVTIDNEKSSPYGGIPQRDLKKNLGCG